METLLLTPTTQHRSSRLRKECKKPSFDHKLTIAVSMDVATALQFFRRWESERGEKDIDSHEGGDLGYWANTNY
ncbi:hypothetical protein YC2023_117265 [Brassica napus]